MHDVFLGDPHKIRLPSVGHWIDQPKRDVVAQTSLSEDELIRLIRFAATNFTFHESSPRQVAHTAISAALENDAKFAKLIH